MNNLFSGGCSGEPLADNGGFVSLEGGMSKLWVDFSVAF